MTDIDRETTTQLEAAAFRRLVEHLRTRTDVQNIDLMNLAGFCRNCLSNWYQEAAADVAIVDLLAKLAVSPLCCKDTCRKSWQAARAVCAKPPKFTTLHK